MRKRQLKFKHRRNFLPTLFLALFFWGLWTWLVFSTAPIHSYLIIAFYLLLFSASFLTAALIFANSCRGFLVATAIVGFLLLRYYQLGNPLNLILLLSILLCAELYWRSGKKE